jgi:hypothetical protein
MVRKEVREVEGDGAELTAPQELQVLSAWPEAPHLGHSVPCMLTYLYCCWSLVWFEAVELKSLISF